MKKPPTTPNLYDWEAATAHNGQHEKYSYAAIPLKDEAALAEFRAQEFRNSSLIHLKKHGMAVLAAVQVPYRNPVVVVEVSKPKAWLLRTWKKFKAWWSPAPPIPVRVVQGRSHNFEVAAARFYSSKDSGL